MTDLVTLEAHGESEAELDEAMDAWWRALHAVRETLFRAFERSRKRLVGEGRFADLWGGCAGCLYCEHGSLIAEPSLALVATKPGAKRSPKKR